jgi:hypothetical protein
MRRPRCGPDSADPVAAIYAGGKKLINVSCANWAVI